MCRKCKEVFLLPIALEAGALVPEAVKSRIAEHENKMHDVGWTPVPFTIANTEAVEIIGEWLSA